LIEHYEKVREAVLGRDSSCGSRWGQALLASRGVAAWMQAAGQWLTPLLPLPPASSAAAASMPALVRQDLVRLMGEVVLSVAQKSQVP
jgi:hypothetical protein